MPNSSPSVLRCRVSVRKVLQLPGNGNHVDHNNNNNNDNDNNNSNNTSNSNSSNDNNFPSCCVRACSNGWYTQPLSESHFTEPMFGTLGYSKFVNSRRILRVLAISCHCGRPCHCGPPPPVLGRRDSTALESDSRVVLYTSASCRRVGEAV